MNYDIFISYSSQDLSISMDICQKLEETGLTCWMAPRDIDTGISFAKAIIEGIKCSQNILLIYTANSNISEQVLREVDRAVHFEKRLLVFKLDDQKYSESLEYYLCKADSIDATKGKYQQYLKQIENKVRPLTKKKPKPFTPTELKPNLTNIHIKKRTPSFFLFFMILILLISSGVYFQKMLLSQPSIEKSKNISAPLPKSNDLINKNFPLPKDLYQQASEKLYDENLISKLGFVDLKLLSQQIQSREGIFIKNSRAGLIENQLSDMAKDNLDLIDHFIISKLSTSLPGNSCKKFCLSILGKRPIHVSEYRVLKGLENVLVKKYGVRAQKLYKTQTQKIPDMCQDPAPIPIEIGFNQALGLDIYMKIFSQHNSFNVDPNNDFKVKVELIETFDDNARIQVFFSKEENLVDLIRRYAVLVCN